jgi:(S)-3,5-dihydroxyphenylglycine transaminase
MQKLMPGYENVSPLGVMNFLSEVEFDYPKAISFASGRPTESFFDLDAWLGAIGVFQKHDAELHGYDTSASARRLAQYGRTGGLINAIVAAQVANDDGLTCTPEQIVITNGCQEAMALCLQTLCCHPGDVILARNPTYIGVTGAARLAGVELAPVDAAADGSLAGTLRRTVAALHARGKRVRGLYLIPEFDNPTGAVISVPDREAILVFCAERNIVILEDSTYGMFRFEGDARPALATLDTSGTVIYLGTYSKTLCPSVRVGSAIVPKTLFGDAAASREFLASMTERKSFLTVNTSQFNQALVGGVLLAEGCSLRRLVRPALEFYRRNRDALMERLAVTLGTSPAGIRWNHPQGGFFLSVELPFRFEACDMVRCASEYDVIVMPMSFFSLDDSQANRVRLAFSNLSVEQVGAGIERFAAYIHDRLAQETVYGSFTSSVN